MYQVTTLLILAVFVLLMTGVGRVVFGPLFRRTTLSRLEKGLVSFCGGTLFLYFGVFLLGIFRLDIVSMGILSAVIGILGTIGIRQASAGLSLTPTMPGMRVENLLWLSCAGLALVILLQGFAPPTNYDSLYYHISYPKFDVEQGRISPPWNRAFPGMFFPALGGHMSRFALVLWDASLAQMFHGCFMIVSALAATAITLRLGYSRTVAATAALLFLLLRVVSWQGATTETDLLITGLATVALIAYLGLREDNSASWAVLFGALLGAAILSKYHGFPYIVAMAPVVLFDLFTRRISFSRISIAAGVCSLLLVPHFAWNIWHTGNPIYPLFNSLFSPGGINPFEGYSAFYGAGRDFLTLAITPWLFSVFPTKYFDGMVLGAPYLVAFVPLVLIGKSYAKRWGIITAVIAAYYVLWFFLLTQQVRFLLPILPLMAAMAAGGLSDFWQSTGRFAIGRIVVVLLCGIFAVTQLSFFSAYALLRLPVSFGLMTKEHYLTKTPTFRQARYPACAYLNEHLKPGERYFSITMIAFECPQTSAIYRYFPDEEKWWLTRMPDDQPRISLTKFIAGLKRYNVRYVVVPHSYERRRNDQSVAQVETPDVSSVRLGLEITQAVTTLTPLAKGPFVALYDADAVINNLISAPK